MVVVLLIFILPTRSGWSGLTHSINILMLRLIEIINMTCGLPVLAVGMCGMCQEHVGKFTVKPHNYIFQVKNNCFRIYDDDREMFENWMKIVFIQDKI